jgi:hypothetical protein
MKSLYQTTLEQFTGTQELKEGDCVVCPMYPNEIFKVKFDNNGRCEIQTPSISRLFNRFGRSFDIEDFPLYLKCSPPKKKVEKVFDVYIFENHFKYIGSSSNAIFISTGKDEEYNIKAKLIVEIEE